MKTITELNAKITELDGKVADLTTKQSALEAATLAKDNKQDARIAELEAEVGAGADFQPQFDAVSAIEAKVDAVNTKLDTQIAEQQI